MNNSFQEVEKIDFAEIFSLRNSVKISQKMDEKDYYSLRETFYKNKFRPDFLNLNLFRRGTSIINYCKEKRMILVDIRFKKSKS